MAWRRGVQQAVKLASRSFTAGSGNGVAQSIAAEASIGSKTNASAVQFARYFAAQPAAVADATHTGAITQVMLTFIRLQTSEPLHLPSVFNVQGREGSSYYWIGGRAQRSARVMSALVCSHSWPFYASICSYKSPTPSLVT